VNESARDQLGGTPTSARPTATRFNVAMTVVLLIALPPFVYYLWACLAFNHGRPMIPSTELLEQFPWPTATSVGIVAGWLLFQALLQQYAPGRLVEGTPLADGKRLVYRMNGWFAWWFTWVLLVAAVALGVFSATILADQFGPLLTTANIFSYLFCVYLYWHGKQYGTKHERTSGNPIYDFWRGTALNPRVGNFDLKLFCERAPDSSHGPRSIYRSPPSNSSSTARSRPR
jgi:hypothetical protein